MKKIFSITALFALLTVTNLFAQTPASSPQTLNLEIKGMSCPMCATKIENSIKKLGATKCSVNDQSGKAVVEYDSAKVSPEQIIETCNKSGFKCQKI